MRKFILSIAVFFSLSVAAHAEEAPAGSPPISFSPEFAQVMQIYQQMTPQQKAEVMEQAKRIQAELEKMPPEERQRLYSNAADAAKNIDFNNLDVSKIDTSKQVTVSQVDDFMDKTKGQKLKASNYRSPTAAGNPSKPVVDSKPTSKPFIQVHNN